MEIRTKEAVTTMTNMTEKNDKVILSEIVKQGEEREEVVYEDRGLNTLDGCDTVLASLWYGLNYGSIISAFALYKVVEKMGRRPILLGKPETMWTSHYDNPESIAGKFIHANCRVASRSIMTEELNKCKYFLTGPDVVWNYDICGQAVSNIFVGDFVHEYMQRISCASSFGKVQENGMEQKDILKMKRNLQKFQGVSVRNGYDVGVCQNLLGIDSEIILDPVFLCDREEYEKVIRTAHFDAKGPYILTYIKHGNTRIKKYIEEGVRIHNKDSRNYIDINRFPESSKELGLDITFHVMADDWLCSIWNSDFVVTDSYYGVCFSILFHKPFVVITSPDFKTCNEIQELLGWFELEERAVPCDDYSDMKDYIYLFRKRINWGYADRKLEQLRSESLKWLEERLVERGEQ